jgi:glycerol-3-phosphate acyltransferase PlsX
MIKIALDAMGGDYAPKAMLEGALSFKTTSPDDIEVVLIGNEPLIKSVLKEMGVDENTFSIVHAEQVIGMNEHPAKAFTHKPDSSIAKGFGLLASGEVQAFTSAGNTGAMMVGSMFTIKPIEGVIRPAIAGFIPKQKGSYGILLDAGANADCKPEALDQFAILGTLYSKYVYDIANPTVGLMNLGEEETKGTVALQNTHQLLKANTKINFIGNIEGRDVFENKADVIICDGYTGNIILKLGETFFNLTSDRNFKHPFFDLFNYENVGGSPILGVNGNVVVGHGVSSGVAIKSMIDQAVQLVRADITTKIKNAFTAKN